MSTVSPAHVVEGRRIITDTRRFRIETIVDSDPRWPYAIAHVSLTGEEITGVELTVEQVVELVDHLQVTIDDLRNRTPVEFYPV